jgi:hypothetical protein
LIAGQARDAFEDLVAVLDDSSAEVRYFAAQALVRIAASRAEAAIPNLVAALESAEAGIRREAVELLDLLAKAGRSAHTALPALKKLLTDPAVCLDAALTLVEIDAGQAAVAVPVLVEALERCKLPEIPAYRVADTPADAVLAALRRIGPPAAVAVPLLRQAMRAQTTGTRVHAASVLARIAPEAPEWKADAVNMLLAAVADVDDMDLVFWDGLAALVELGPAAKGVVPQLEGMLLDEEKRGLAGALCDGDPGALLCAALVKIDPTASHRVLAHVEAGLQAPERFDQAVKLLIDLVREVPDKARDVVPLLQEQLQGATPEKASRINDALARIGRASSERLEEI